MEVQMLKNWESLYGGCNLNTMMEQMLKQYHTQTVHDQKNAMKEVMQEIILCGLSRANFFKKRVYF